jgi:hypothetical protein
MLARDQWTGVGMPYRELVASNHSNCAMIGPDFVGIGAARSGTSWLYEALEHHPSIWLPPIKELHYFDDPSRGKRYYSYLRMRLISGLWIRRPLSVWDLRYFFGRPSDEWYCRLFDPGRRCGLLTGEITPAYAILDEATLTRMRGINPQLKLIYLMRDPVMRCWSAVMKLARLRGLAESPNVEDAIDYAHSEGVWARSSYLNSIERLERVFQPAQIFYGFFDELCDDPNSLMTRLLMFLGVAPGDVGRLLPAGPVNAAAAGTQPPPEFERALAARFLPCVNTLCERFDGPPHIWRARYKAILGMDAS